MKQANFWQETLKNSTLLALLTCQLKSSGPDQIYLLGRKPLSVKILNSKIGPTSLKSSTPKKISTITSNRKTWVKMITKQCALGFQSRRMRRTITRWSYFSMILIRLLSSNQFRHNVVSLLPCMQSFQTCKHMLSTSGMASATCKTSQLTLF